MTAPPQAADADVLADVVGRQHHEIEHLRKAMRHRAVIEQAKGVLIGWLAIEPDEAFRHLVGYSQRTNQPLSRAAAAIVAHALDREPRPDHVGALPTDAQLFDPGRFADLERRLTDAALVAAPDLTRLLAEIIDAAGDLAPDGLLVGAVEPDGAVRILGSRGYPAEVIAGWERVPPTADVPLADSAKGRPVFLGDRGELVASYPGARNILHRYDALACLPVILGGRLIGVIGMSWQGRVEMNPERHAQLEALADRCARPLGIHLRDREALDVALPHLSIDPARSGWLQSALAQVAAPVAVLEPRSAPDGRLQDLRIIFLNDQAGAHLDDPTALVGRSAVELAPWLPSSPLFAAAETTDRTGQPQRLAEVTVPVNVEGRQGVVLHDVGIARLGALLLVSWRTTQRSPD